VCVCVCRKICTYIFSVSAADWWFSTFVFMTFRQGHKVCGFISRNSAMGCGVRVLYTIYIIWFFFLTRKISFCRSRHLFGIYVIYYSICCRKIRRIPRPCVPNSVTRLLSFLVFIFPMPGTSTSSRRTYSFP
jgi:hypothetical protein